ncbi:hypothetical protein RUM44_003065 [Polyplax serrata]|uniref:Uncharacterized protein n=1 Tax=Polyplax serrata TaxID=468196 RepID=A0ABR1AXH2_POLSC
MNPKANGKPPKVMKRLSDCLVPQTMTKTLPIRTKLRHKGERTKDATCKEASDKSSRNEVCSQIDRKQTTEQEKSQQKQSNTR